MISSSFVYIVVTVVSRIGLAFEDRYGEYIGEGFVISETTLFSLISVNLDDQSGMK